MSGGDWKEMFQAAESGDLELVRYHISQGVDPNYQHPEILSSALVASILSNHTDIAKYLLENGAKPDLKSYLEDMTPLQAAKKMKNRDLIALLKSQQP